MVALVLGREVVRVAVGMGVTVTACVRVMVGVTLGRRHQERTLK